MGILRGILLLVFTLAFLPCDHLRQPRTVVALGSQLNVGIEGGKVRAPGENAVP